MKITVLLASHRSKKNTAQTAEYFLEHLKDGNEIEYVNLLNKKIEICLACDYCRSTMDTASSRMIWNRSFRLFTKAISSYWQHLYISTV
ncbi:NAD(P)H-dependent oxidoreductase [Acidaminobacter sp.]|uniref:NAD(P)H-dependent oxidoreductase n=1 Tax=Acidaminobacter sp. TaxID=1872102 RepID=UPI0039C893D6